MCGVLSTLQPRYITTSGASAPSARAGRVTRPTNSAGSWSRDSTFTPRDIVWKAVCPVARRSSTARRSLRRTRVRASMNRGFTPSSHASRHAPEPVHVSAQRAPALAGSPAPCSRSRTCADDGDRIACGRRRRARQSGRPRRSGRSASSARRSRAPGPRGSPRTPVSRPSPFTPRLSSRMVRLVGTHESGSLLRALYYAASRRVRWPCPPRERETPGEAAPSRPATRARMDGPRVLGADSRRSNARPAGTRTMKAQLPSSPYVSLAPRPDARAAILTRRTFRTFERRPSLRADVLEAARGASRPGDAESVRAIVIDDPALRNAHFRLTREFKDISNHPRADLHFTALAAYPIGVLVHGFLRRAVSVPGRHRRLTVPRLVC